jgi:hypothetical protein
MIDLEQDECVQNATIAMKVVRNSRHHESKNVRRGLESFRLRAKSDAGCGLEFLGCARR